MTEPPIIPPISPRTRRRGAREALVCIGVAAVLLVLCQGPSIRRSGERMDPGPIRTSVLAVGRPAAWLADRLPLASVVHTLTAWLSPDANLATAQGGFGTLTAGAPGKPRAGAVEPVTPDAFDPRDLGGPPARKHALRTLLVTGDSMSMPLDAVLARRLAGGQATQVIRDPHIGTGISKSGLVDWGKLSADQVGRDRADAVVVFLGANEGFPLRAADGRAHQCCDAAWAATYATRARAMMNAYRRGGLARVYWLTLPLPREDARRRIALAVNAAIRAAAGAYRAQVRVLDMAALFTPGGRYRDSMPVGSAEKLVRQADGIHLNETGAELAAGAVLRAVAQDFQDVPAAP